MSPMKQDHAQVVFERLPDAVLVVEENRVIYANEAARVLLGSKKTSLIDVPLADLIGEEGVERTVDHLDAHPPGTLCSCVTNLVVRGADDKEPLVTDCRATRIPDGEDPLAGAVILVLRELREFSRAEQLIATLAGLARSNVALTGLLGVIEAARPMFDSLGWWATLMKTSESGAEVVKLIGPEDLDHPLVKFAKHVRKMGPLPWAWFPMVRRVYESGEPVFMVNAPNRIGKLSGLGPEFAERMRQGGFSRAVWVPIRPGGVTTHILLIVGPDLTEHDLGAMELLASLLAAGVRLEDLQRELVRRERLAAVGEMSGVLAHEVRNPLAVIFNSVAGLKKSIGGNGDRDGLLNIIHEEADRLKRVVSDLLEFARPTVPEFRPLEIVELVREAVETAEKKNAGLGVRLEVQLPDDLPMIDSDPFLLNRVLANVLDNAFQSVSEGGVIQVLAKRADETWVDLIIRNDGEPLSEEMRAKAFLPFFTTRATGTGLGLSVVKKTAEDLGARVDLDSDEIGTVFTVRLPVSESAVAKPKEKI